MGSDSLDCIELESQFWVRLFDREANEFRYKVREREKDEEIIETMEETIGALKKWSRSSGECNYDSVSEKEWNPARLFTLFACERSISAEAAITDI